LDIGMVHEVAVGLALIVALRALAWAVFSARGIDA
jgi:hypothetical protein